MLIKHSSRINIMNNRGFSLIELVISVAIVSVIMALVMFNFKGFEKSTVLANEAEKLSSVIRQAQIWALTGQLQDGVRPPGGYGVSFTSCLTPPCEYILFSDNNNNHLYDGASEQAPSGVNQLHEHVTISLEIDSFSESYIDLDFTPPTSTIFFNNDNNTYDVATIHLTHQISGLSKDVTINRISGQIDIQ